LIADVLSCDTSNVSFVEYLEQKAGDRRGGYELDAPRPSPVAANA
jgi:hypothetical protein